MDKNEIRKEVQERFLEVRKILHSYDLIPGSPKSEFDSLNHKIVSHLYKGADYEKIYRVLESEFIIRYGLSPEGKITQEIAAAIMDWWRLKTNEQGQETSLFS